MPSLVSLYLHTHPKHPITVFSLPITHSVSPGPFCGHQGQGAVVRALDMESSGRS